MECSGVLLVLWKELQFSTCSTMCSIIILYVILELELELELLVEIGISDMYL